MNYNDFCDRWLAAWTGNRPMELIKFYHPNVFYSDPARREGVIGYKNLIPYFEKLLSLNPKWVWTREEIFLIENGFMVRWSAVIPAGDVTIRETGLDICVLKDGLIIRNEVYFDRHEWLAAMRRSKAEV